MCDFCRSDVRFFVCLPLGLSYAPTSQDMSDVRNSMPMVSIRPGYVTFYSEAIASRSSSFSRPSCADLPCDNRAAGLISHKAERRLGQAVDWLIYLAKSKALYPDRDNCRLRFRVNFITLTLSSLQVHDDNTIKKQILQPFLDTLRKSWGAKHYLWRAESQRNGNIHFHLVTDTYIPWWKIRNRWNEIQNTLGYVDRFHEKHPKKVPNSTDVHSVNKIRNLGAYLAKYCSKNPNGSVYTALKESDNHLVPCYNPSEAIALESQKQRSFRTIEGNLWGLSYSLSRIRSVIACTLDFNDGSLQRFWAFYSDKVKEYDHHTCVFVPVSEWAKRVGGEFYACFREYLSAYQNLAPPIILTDK